MPAFPIPKPSTESPRPQRRHYADRQLFDLQNKLLKCDLRPQTSDSTYQSDYPHYPSGSPRTDRRSRRKADSYIAPLTDLERLNQQITKYPRAAPPSQKSADHLLYLSTYQAAYTTQRQRLGVGEFHYMDDKERQLERQASSPETTPSLYQDSFINHSKANMVALGNPGKEHVMTKSLYQDMTPELTVTDLLRGDGKSKRGTSYKFDFRHFSEFQSQPKPLVSHEPMPPVPRAVKYRRWAQM
nr:hypothetical protein HK105_000500 [Polyrhizophydium stewartii]